MAIHKEKALPLWSVALILSAAFLLIYPPWDFGARDLFWDEGEYAAIVSEIHSFPPSLRAHGQLIDGFYPLFPLLAKGLTMLGVRMELALRLISVGSLAGLSVMAGIIGWRTAGRQAAAAAAAAMFTTVLTAEKAVEGYPQLLTILLIFSGWLVWFGPGQFNGSWKLGWLANGFFGGLAFYAGGWSALVYFFVPMMFLKRPFTPWRRFNNPGFPVGILTVLLFILLWLAPRWAPGEAVGGLFVPNLSVMKYLSHSVNMAVGILFRFLPWTFFLYAPFCAALIAIDKNPLFARYLRILFTVTAAILVLNPFTKARDILYLLPLFALMTGLNYGIVVRRHGDRLCRMLRWTAAAVFLLCAGAFLFVALAASPLPPAAFLKNYLEFLRRVPLMPGLIKTAAGMACAATAYVLALRKQQIWLIMVLFFTSGMLFFWGVIHPFRATQRSRSNLGTAMRRALGPAWKKELTVYKDAAISGLYPECYYLGTRIRTIPFANTGKLDGKEVYLLSASSIQPPDPSRSWSKILDVIYKGKNLYMWKGILNERKDGAESDIRYLHF